VEISVHACVRDYAKRLLIRYVNAYGNFTKFTTSVQFGDENEMIRF